MNATTIVQPNRRVNFSGQPTTQGNRRNGKRNGTGKTPTPYQKKDGNWYCTYKGKQYYLGTDPLKAQIKLDEILTGTKLRKTRGGPTLQSIADAYLDSLINNQSDDTIRTKRLAYKQFLEFVGPDTPISHITRDEIEQFKQREIACNCKATARTKLISLSALFQYATDLKLIPKNPVREVPKIKHPEDPDPDHLTEKEVTHLLKLTEEQRYHWLRHRDKLIFMLMLHGGLRRIEVCNLKWSDVQLERNLLVLRTTKGQKPRMIGISKTLGEFLQDFQDNWSKNEEYVVTNRAGQRISRSAMSHIAQKYVARLNHKYQGRRRFSLHSLRATFATQLASKGVSTRVIQGLLGHSSPTTVLRYAAYTERMAVDAVKVLDG